ncbi:Nicastrin-domain-containing protein [Chlamydoabsidia padenii]|nr:Nicastrin-domain-containing protein [Chlamydoabsidia padenii]
MRFLLLVLGIWATIASSQDIDTSLYPHIYTNLVNWPCVRLLNSTHTIGCQAPSTGSGVLYQINTQDEITNFIGQSSLNDAFAIILPYNLLTPSNIQALETTRRVTGIIALLTSALNTAPLTSPDSNCPNCQFGLYASEPDAHVWNPQGTGLINESFDIPIYGINPTSNQSAQVYNDLMMAIDYNKQRNYQQYPLQAVDFNLMMWAARDSSTCLRRGWCQPVGGLSVFSTPSQNISVDDNKPIIVLAASLDSRSLFHDLTVGVDTSISGMVTLLSVADALNRAPTSPANLDKHILYTLFTAESWGFAGSQRFVQDISRPFVCLNSTRSSPCPYPNAPCTLPCVQDLKFKQINLNNIDTIIEFGSINSGNTTVWAHVDDNSLSKPLVQALQTQANVNFNINNSSPLVQGADDDIQRRLPPSSTMSFLQQKRSTKAVVLTGYKDKMDSSYNSDLDNQVDLEQLSQKLCGLVNTTAQTVYQQAQTTSINTTSSPLVTANCTLVHELLDCLIYNFSCNYMQNYFNVSGLDKVNHYSSVYSFNSPQPQYIPRFVFSYLAGITGAARLDQHEQPTTCTRIQDCRAGEYCIRQRCITTMTSYHPAYGTGLNIDESTGKISVENGTKGTYTESTWDSPSLRIFLVPSRQQQYIELVIGLIWTIISVAFVVFAKRYAKSRFKLD